ncbi:hypothetical protein O3M35_007979 [Rhynocoris fuscipes]|uniref:Odorant receptor n=1 Tax=Rhynocoris fuscipes TaxID=488301 RepID=A0AAW1DCQ4_9HEMI
MVIFDLGGLGVTNVNLHATQELLRKIITGKTDDLEFMSGYQIRVFWGLTYDHTWSSIFVIIITITINILGATHNLLTVILHHDQHDVLSLMELCHYATLFISLLSMCSVTISQSKKTKTFCELLEKDFNNPNEELSPRQNSIKQYSNTFICTLGKWLIVLFFSGISGSYLRRPILESAPDPEEYTLPYIGWVPFKVDTIPKCIPVWIFQAAISINVVCGHYCFFMSFAIHANHLYSHCDMLAVHLEETFDFDSVKTSNREYYIKRRLKEAIKKHQILIRYFFRIQDLYSYSLLAMGLFSGLMFCTCIYMVSDPDSTIYMIASVSSFMIGEFILIGLYCWFGQRVVDKWENIKDTIYNIEWYTQSITTKKTLLLIMTMCTRDKVIKGGGLQEFSMKGFSELLQAGFSSYNMLKAMRN